MKTKYEIEEFVLTNCLNLVAPIVNAIPNKALAVLIKAALPFSKKKDALRLLYELLKEDHKSIVTIKKISDSMPARQRKAMIRAFFINVFIIGLQQRKAFEQKTGVHPLTSILISPTMKCNSRCKYCSAARHSQSEDMSLELFDRILNEATEMGTHTCMVLGGEPFIRKDILKVFGKHKDIGFVVYTNGTLFDKKLAMKIARLGNVITAFSIEGFEKKTDERRGKGSYKQVLKAMSYAKEYGLFYGYAVTITRKNFDEVTSDKFIDAMIKNGCSMGWHFPYVPVGKNPLLSRVLTPEQKINLAKKVSSIRKRKKILLYDYLQNPLFEGGCKAGGSGHIHIISNGNVEPCTLVHFYVDNVKSKPLKDVLASDFFKMIQYRKTDEDGIRPCLVMQNPKMLKKLVENSGAKPSCRNAEWIFSKKASTKMKKHSNKYKKERMKFMKHSYMNFNKV